MSWLLAVLVVVAFAFVVHLTRLPLHAREAIDRSRASHAVVRDPTLDDAVKERHLRQEAPLLFGLLVRLVFGSGLALGLPLGALWALDRIGFVSMEEVLGILTRVDFVLVVSALAVLAAWWSRRSR